MTNRYCMDYWVPGPAQSRLLVDTTRWNEGAWVGMSCTIFHVANILDCCNWDRSFVRTTLDMQLRILTIERRRWLNIALHIFNHHHEARTCTIVRLPILNLHIRALFSIPKSSSFSIPANSPRHLRPPHLQQLLDTDMGIRAVRSRSLPHFLPNPTSTNSHILTFRSHSTVSPEANSSPPYGILNPQTDPTSPDLTCGRNATHAWNALKTATIRAGEKVGFAAGELMLPAVSTMPHPPDLCSILMVKTG